MAPVHVLNHPLIQHKLAILRNKNTTVKEFRELISEISGLMCYEATRNLPTVEVEVETPITTAKCQMLSGKKLAIVPILRAGLGLVPHEAIVVENAPLGVQAGVAANLFTIAVNTGPLHEDVLYNAGASYVFPSMPALADEWEKLFEALTA